MTEKWCAECNCEAGGDNCTWIGKYRANYSPVTPEEIAAPDPELDELHRNSTPIVSQVRE